MFEKIGVPVYYADDRAKALMDSNYKLRIKLQNAFGFNIYKYKYPGLQWLGFSDMVLNRKALAEIVFNDKRKLEILNSIVHPFVAEDFDRWANLQNSEYVIEEAAIAIETGSAPNFDHIIVVTADEDIRIKRTMARDNCTEEQVRARMENQMSDEDRIKFANTVIINEGNSELEEQVISVNKSILKHLEVKNV